jgi:hypothetical protein
MKAKLNLGFSENENQMEDISIDVKISYNKSQFHQLLEETLRRGKLETEFKDKMTEVIREIEYENDVNIGIVDNTAILCEEGLKKIVEKMEMRYKIDECNEDDLPF